MNCLLRTRKNQEKDKAAFLRNGKILLEKLLTCSDGKWNPIRGFSAEELKLATNNYDTGEIIASYDHYNLHKGFLQNRPISVMKFKDYYGEQSCFNNLVFASQMTHKNVLQLIGCCLETEIPTLVFESVEYDTLADRLHGLHGPHFQPLLWAHRLKIATEIANAVAYLHLGFQRPIIFKVIQPSNILFDEQNVAKLCDFSESEVIPNGETHVKSEIMTVERRYFAPEYILTGFCNEKSDVYCFGRSLIELLTGKDGYPSLDSMKKHVENNEFDEIVDPIIAEDRFCAGKELQLQAFVKLAFNCIKKSPVDRPTMVDVAKQLRQIFLSVDVEHHVT
ncbi:putative Receptor protein kinase [Melia azedarach]|uniref:Receptor protein kinase n=1 Tax=Melia azedarach TaxID=155640 RepID=A0ACC1X5M5_MELAZ|nr:putative Receptor protein kinase [Melia azedarach]